MRGLFYTTRVPRAFPQGGAAGRLAAGTHTKRSRCNARHGARLPRLGLHVAAIPPAGARPARSAQRCAARAGPPRAAHPPEARCVKRRGTYPLRATMSLRRSVGVTTTRANCRANSLLEADAAMRPILRAPPPVPWRHAIENSRTTGALLTSTGPSPSALRSTWEYRVRNGPSTTYKYVVFGRAGRTRRGSFILCH